MLENRYNNIEWSVPFLLHNEILCKAISNVHQDKKTIKTIYSPLFYRPSDIDYELDTMFDLKGFKSLFNSQFEISEYDVDPRIFYDDKFSKVMSYLDKNNSSIVISNDFLFNYLRKKFKNIQIIASETKSFNEMKYEQEVDFYENLIQKFDKVILNAEYVKGNFLKDYKDYSDISKFEIYVNYRPIASQDINNDLKSTLALTNDEIKFLIEEVGIKNFRIYGYGESIGCALRTLFDYVFVPDAQSIYEFTRYLDEIFYNNGLKEVFDDK